MAKILKSANVKRNLASQLEQTVLAVHLKTKSLRKTSLEKYWLDKSLASSSHLDLLSGVKASWQKTTVYISFKIKLPWSSFRPSHTLAGFCLVLFANTPASLWRKCPAKIIKKNHKTRKQSIKSHLLSFTEEHDFFEGGELPLTARALHGATTKRQLNQETRLKKPECLLSMSF